MQQALYRSSLHRSSLHRSSLHRSSLHWSSGRAWSIGQASVVAIAILWASIPSASAGWRAVTDGTGVRVELPEDLDVETTTKFGRNYRTDDRAINVDTLDFGTRTIDDIDETLRDKDGRRITRRDIDDTSLVLDGRDADGTQFIVRVKRRNGRTRGLSIVHRGRRADLAEMARRIAGSFVAFPGAAPPREVLEAPRVAPPPPIPPPARDEDLTRRMADLEARLREQEAAARRAEAEVKAAREARERAEAPLPKPPPIAPTQPATLPSARVAFVVGIDDYRHLPKLQRAGNDAVTIRTALRTLGFDVVDGTDLDSRSFYDKWYAFLAQVEAGGVAAVFFAGHGFQFDGGNYLAVADSPGLDVRPQVLMRQSVNFDELRSELAARKPRVTLFVLDACRNNPYVARAATRTAGGVRRGLAPVDAARGTFIMYSADPGEEALDRMPDDGTADVNSLYTRYLASLLAEGTHTLQAMALRLRSAVREAAATVSHAQTPAYYDGLVGPVCLTPACTRTSQAE
jgi:hypothetical protein